MKSLGLLIVMMAAILVAAGCGGEAKKKGKPKAAPAVKVLAKTAQVEVKKEKVSVKPVAEKVPAAEKKAISYNAEPLKISEIEDARLAQTRSAGGSGFAWGFRRAGFRRSYSTSRYGWVLDSQNKWSNQHKFSGAPVALEIYANSLPVDVREGDYVTLTYDGGKSLRVYPPPLSGKNGTFYIDSKGNTYTDRELSHLAQAAPSSD